MQKNLHQKQSITSSLEMYFEKQEMFLDGFIDHGSEQELFIASYIHGHYSVVCSNFLSTIVNFNEQEISDLQYEDVQANFKSQLRNSIQHAIQNGELKEKKDIEQVNDLLNTLLSM